VNPCGDPPAGVGGLEEPPGAEGGALRSQNSQKLGGKIIRIDPETGEGGPGNPLFASFGASENERRIVGKGFRNPFRFAIDPDTKDVYVDNVGSSVYEEIDRFSPSPSQLFNSGWPCYEGPEKRELYEFRGLKVCDDLYATPGSTSQPFFYYSHNSGVTPEDPCPYEPGSAISGLAFYEGNEYPGYHGALFFADAVRGCIYVMHTGEDGRPDPSKVEPFLTEGGLYPGRHRGGARRRSLLRQPLRRRIRPRCDPQDPLRPGRSRLYHCPGGPESCHAHPLQVFPARESGTLVAPDHDLPSHIELSLTATDARGLSSTTTVNLYPNVSFLGMRSDPPGIVLSAGLQTEATPFGVEAIEDSGVTLTAPATTRSTTARYEFSAANSRFKCKLDKGAYRACRSPQTYKKLKPGSHSFAVVAIAGGKQGKPTKFSWKVLKPKGR
jgi:hypothetical protein